MPVLGTYKIDCHENAGNIFTAGHNFRTHNNAGALRSIL
jgi:hypothetical protein